MVEDKTDQPKRQVEDVTLTTIRDEIRDQGTKIVEAMKRQSDEQETKIAKAIGTAIGTAMKQQGDDQLLFVGLAAAVALIVGAATVEDIGVKMAMAFGAGFLVFHAGIILKRRGSCK